jgi:hypothetical protein
VRQWRADVETDGVAVAVLVQNHGSRSAVGGDQATPDRRESGSIEIRRGRRALETLVEPCLELARMALDHVEVRLPPGREPPASLQGIGHGHLDAGAP